MEDSRCRIAAIKVEDPRCRSLLMGVEIEMEDPRYKGPHQDVILKGATIEIEDARCKRVGIEMEDPRCWSLHIW